MIFTRHFSSSLMHNPLYALNWHISTDAEAPSDLTARLWLLVGKPFCAVLTVLPGTATSPKTTTHLQIRQLLVSLLYNLPAATVPVISETSVGEGFHNSEWAAKARAVAEAVTQPYLCCRSQTKNKSKEYAQVLSMPASTFSCRYINSLDHFSPCCSISISNTKRSTNERLEKHKEVRYGQVLHHAI